jgi:hypothetical protein
MSEEEKQIRVDSRAWTGDISDASAQQDLPKWLQDDRPQIPTTVGGALGVLAAHFISRKIDPKSDVLGAYRHAPHPRVEGHKTPAILLAGPLCLCITAFCLGIFIDTDLGYFRNDYLASQPVWLSDASFTYAIIVIACMIVLLASKFIALPDWTNRASAAIGVLLIGFVGLNYAWTIEAHRKAHILGPVEPLLLAHGNSCGKKFGLGRGGGPPDPGPCVHGFRAMNRQGEMLWLTGRGMARERACILAQKISDGHGFVWYRRIAYHDLLPEMGVTDFPADLGRSCLDGTLMQRFEPLLER